MEQLKQLIWLDDKRNPDGPYGYKGDRWIDLAPIPKPFETTWIKDPESFKAWVNKYGLPDAICFDHDLGECESGYDCAKFVIDYCLDNNVPVPKYVVQSSNPVGKANIEGIFKSFLKQTRI